MSSREARRLVEEWVSNRKRLCGYNEEEEAEQEVSRKLAVDEVKPLVQWSINATVDHKNVLKEKDMPTGTNVQRYLEYQRLLATQNQVMHSKVELDRYAIVESIINKHSTVKRNVLIFDEQSYDSSVKKVFSEKDFFIEESSDLEQAIALYHRKVHLIDVVVLGLQGPVYAALRFLETFSPIKVPVIITYSDEDIIPVNTNQKEVGEKVGDSSVASGEEIQESMDIEAALELAKTLGANVILKKPVDSLTLVDRVEGLIKRFGKAAKEYKRMLDLADPEYSVRQAKEMVLSEIAAKEARGASAQAATFTPSSSYFLRQVTLAPKDTVDVTISGLAKTNNRFALALKKSKQVQQAKIRSENSQLKRRIETHYLSNRAEIETLLLKCQTRSDSLFYSEGGLDGITFSNVAAPPTRRIRRMSSANNTSFKTMFLATQERDGETQDRDVYRLLFGREMSEGKPDSDAKLAMSIIKGMAVKKRLQEGTLPLLRDHNQKLSYIKLPWEAERQRRKVELYGKAPILEARDILQSDFREIIPTKVTSSGQRLLQKGHELKKSGDLLGAVRLFTRATVADHSNSAAYICRGVAHHLLGDNAAALTDFTESLRIDPKSTSARFNRALIFVNDGRDNEAIAELNEAIAISPTDPELLNLRAFVSRRSGAFQQSQEDYKARKVLLAQLEDKRLESKRNRLQKQQRARSVKSHTGSLPEWEEDEVFQKEIEDDNFDLKDNIKFIDEDFHRNELEDDDDFLNALFAVNTSGSKQNAVHAKLRRKAIVTSLVEKKRNDEEFDDCDESEIEDNVNSAQLNSASIKECRAMAARNTLSQDGRADLAELTNTAGEYDTTYARLFQRKSELELACAKPPNRRKQVDLSIIEAAAREIMLFRRMPKRKLRELCREIRIASVLPGDYVVQQGAPSYNFFAILEGVVNVTVSFSEFDTEHVVNKMGPGEVFGENGILEQKPRTVNIVVPSDGDSALIFVIPNDTFVRTDLMTLLTTQRTSYKDLLKSANIFDDLNQEAFSAFAQIVRPVEHKHNTIILTQGAPASRFCILVKGICRTLRYSDYGQDLLKKKQALEQQLMQFEIYYSTHHANVQDDETAARAQDAIQRNELRKLELEKITKKLDDLNADPTKGEKQGKLLHTSTVYPGNFVGEEALLNPFYGKEQYTVVADTYVTILTVHKDQLQTYKQSELLLERVRRRKL